jgi:hypothetical protein
VEGTDVEVLNSMLRHEIQDYKLKFLMAPFEACNLLIQESSDVKRGEHDL